MKKEVHPEYVEGTVKCACGSEFKVLTMKKESSVDICSTCHPFFTGKQKLVDTEGRVERFRRRYNLARK